MNVTSDPTGSLELALAHASRLLSTQPALAAEQAREILRVVPKQPNALLILGAALRQSGEVAQSVDHLDLLCHGQPTWAPAQLEYGLSLARAGRGAEALVAMRRAVELDPSQPWAWRALADQLRASGDDAGAEAAVAQYIRTSTRDPRLLAAAVALCDGRIPEAEALLRKHLKEAPTDVAAIRMLAEVAGRLGRDEDAVHLLERCLELAPGFHEARQNYALVLNRSGKHAAALGQIDQLLAHDPANASFRNLKAVILCRIGDYPPALAIYEQLLREFPRHPKLSLSHGHALKTAGRNEEAVRAYRRCAEVDPGFGDAWWSLANLKTFRFGADDLRRMRTQLDRTDLSPEDRWHLEFAVGKALEDAGEFEGAFRHYESGNRLRRVAAPYSADENTARMRRAKKVLEPGLFVAKAGAGSPAADPIFIVGLPRAGSTLVEQILSSHSQVEGTMELPEVVAITRDLRQRTDSPETSTYHGVLANLSADELRALGEQYLERTRIQRHTDAPRFIDKLPNNFAHVGLIHLILPDARIVDVRRHPRACCFSGFKQHFARGQHFTYGLEDIGRYYRDYVELMAHYDAVLPGRVHRVIYERLVDDTEAEVRRLLDYCGLPFEDGCLRFYENTRAVRTASSEQVRRPIYRDGVEHWKNFEPWLEPLRQALGPVLERYPDVPDFDCDASSD
jgi:tetratricopeptide (TPR) repeat protein